MAAEQSIRFVGQFMITTSGRMNIIPEKIFVRIHPRLALGRINGVDEVVLRRLAQDADHTEPDIQVVNMDGNSITLEPANDRPNGRTELGAVTRRSLVEACDPVGIAEGVRDGAKWRNIRDEKVSRPGVGQAYNQHADAGGGIGHTLGAVIIKQIVAAAPKNV